MNVIQILVASHKEVPLRELPDIYTPIHVGSALRDSQFKYFIRDDQGQNISKKNQFFNELTALYWARYNSTADVIGLVHYRRFFTFSKNKALSHVLTEEDINRLLIQNDAIVPKKRHYWIETSDSHYRHAHHDLGLDTVRQVIANKYPDYLKAYDDKMSQTSAHMFNMMIMKRPVFDAYVDWLFDILFTVEAEIQPTVLEWSQYEQRVYGFLSERLLDVWLIKNDIQYAEVPVKFMEKQNWLLKGSKFIARKVGIGRIDR